MCYMGLARGGCASPSNPLPTVAPARAVRWWIGSSPTTLEHAAVVVQGDAVSARRPRRWVPGRRRTPVEPPQRVLRSGSSVEIVCPIALMTSRGGSCPRPPISEARRESCVTTAIPCYRSAFSSLDAEIGFPLRMGTRDRRCHRYPRRVENLHRPPAPEEPAAGLRGLPRTGHYWSSGLHPENPASRNRAGESLATARLPAASLQRQHRSTQLQQMHCPDRGRHCYRQRVGPDRYRPP